MIMTTNGERTNWVYAGIGVALVATIACGFLWLNQRADGWERAMSRLAVEAPQAGQEAPPAADESQKNQGLEWAAAIVQAIEDGFQAVEERANERSAQLLQELARTFDERLEALEQRVLAEQPSREEIQASILDAVLKVVDQQIEVQVQASQHDEAKRTMAWTLIRTGLAGALEAYRRDMGNYPPDADGMLSGLMNAPEDEELAQHWNGPYVQNALDLLDPWGQELFYECLGTYNQEGYDLASAGPDGEFGTVDDIVNWGEDPEP